MTIDKILFRLSKEIIESNTDNPYLLGIPKRGDLLAQRISNNLLSENFKHDIGKVDYLPFRDDLDKNPKKNNLAISPKDRDDTATAVKRLTIATGPVAKYRDEPKKAATATGMNEAYSP